MINLLKETMHSVKKAGYSKKDIAWIGSKDGNFVVTDLQLLNREYYNSFGDNEVSKYLVIVFKDGSWLERWEYDGSEGWQYRKSPTLNDNAVEATSVFLEEYNDPFEKK